MFCASSPPVPLGGPQCVVLAFSGQNRLLLLAICISQKHKIEHFKGVTAFETPRAETQRSKVIEPTSTITMSSKMIVFATLYVITEI